MLSGWSCPFWEASPSLQDTFYLTQIPMVPEPSLPWLLPSPEILNSASESCGLRAQTLKLSTWGAANSAATCDAHIPGADSHESQLFPFPSSCLLMRLGRQWKMVQAFRPLLLT